MSHHHGPDLNSYSQSGVRLDCQSTMNKGALRPNRTAGLKAGTLLHFFGGSFVHPFR
jgi:hypothetical protein